MPEDKKVKIFVAHEEEATGSHILKGLRYFKEVELIIQVLATADYVVSERVGIEAKASWDDLLKSVDDGRLWDQLSLLKGTYERPILLVVGWDIDYDDMNGKTYIYREKKGGGEGEYRGRYKVDIHRHPDTVRGIIAAIEAGYGIPIHRATNAFRACKYIYRLAWREQIKEQKIAKIQLAKKKKMTVPELQRLTVESLGEGIGPSLAEKMLTVFKTPEKVIAASEEELQTIEGLGKEKSKRIREVAATPYVSIETRKKEKNDKEKVIT